MSRTTAKAGGITVKMARPGWSALLSAAFVVGLGLGAIVLGGPPRPVPASAPPSEFSAERAMAHVEQIAQRPHPVGSPDHARVRDYVAGAIAHLGLKVEIQSTVVRRGTTTVRMARVENILARIGGTNSTGAVLLASHYDSVPAAPGAADAGSGVAAILEAVRALKTAPPPRNDVILLLTDAEELGLLGAKAFVEQHPWAKDVRMVMNFEARGTQGPSWMFETSAGNGAVVAEWASLVPKPAGSSLTYEVYKRLPNDTDFTEFKRLKTAGLNFAFVGGQERYHTPGDNVAALDRGSLQHHGEAALRLARRFASMDLGTLEARDAVYFALPVLDVAPHYSTAWAVPFAVAATVLFVITVVRARRRREASIGGIILAAVIFAAFAGASGYLGWRFGRLAGLAHERWLPEGNVLMSGDVRRGDGGVHHRRLAGALRPAAQAVRRAVNRPRRGVRAACGGGPLRMVRRRRQLRRGVAAHRQLARRDGSLVAPAGLATGGRPDRGGDAAGCARHPDCLAARACVLRRDGAGARRRGGHVRDGRARNGRAGGPDRMRRGAAAMVAGRSRRRGGARVPGGGHDRDALLGPASEAGERHLRAGRRQRRRRAGPCASIGRMRGSASSSARRRGRDARPRSYSPGRRRTACPGSFTPTRPPRICRHRRRRWSGPFRPKAAGTSPSAWCPDGKATCCRCG